MVEEKHMSETTRKCLRLDNYQRTRIRLPETGICVYDTGKRKMWLESQFSISTMSETQTRRKGTAMGSWTLKNLVSPKCAFSTHWGIFFTSSWMQGRTQSLRTRFKETLLVALQRWNQQQVNKKKTYKIITNERLLQAANLNKVLIDIGHTN